MKTFQYAADIMQKASKEHPNGLLTGQISGTIDAKSKSEAKRLITTKANVEKGFEISNLRVEE